MSLDEQKVEQVSKKLDGKEPSSAYQMEMQLFSRRVGGPDPSVPLDQLKKNLDIQRARFFYAEQQRQYWVVEVSHRQRDVNEAVIVYYSKKHNLSDKDLEQPCNQDAHGLFQRIIEDTDE